jgi:hypothetical protein
MYQVNTKSLSAAATSTFKASHARFEALVGGFKGTPSALTDSEGEALYKGAHEAYLAAGYTAGSAKAMASQDKAFTALWGSDPAFRSFVRGQDSRTVPTLPVAYRKSKKGATATATKASKAETDKAASVTLPEAFAAFVKATHETGADKADFWGWASVNVATVCEMIQTAAAKAVPATPEAAPMQEAAPATPEAAPVTVRNILSAQMAERKREAARQAAERAATKQANADARAKAKGKGKGRKAA